MPIKPLRRRSLISAGSAAGALALVGGLLGTPAYADPTRTHLAVTVAATPTQIADVGGGATMTVDVRNAGTRPSQQFTLTLNLPAGAWFATDGFVIPPSWQCDLTGTATCAHASLAVGEAADPLTIPIGLPAGTAGDVVTISATATMDREPSTNNNTGRATITYVPSSVDLFFRSAATHDVMIEGDRYYAVPYVGNAGTVSSGDVTITYPVPAGLTDSTMIPGEGWTCAFDAAAGGGPAWRCTHAPIAPGEITDGSTFSATVSGVAPGDVLTMDQKVSTTSAESNLDNNTLQNTITVVQAATVRGTVWVDQPRNGVRDATDPGVPPGPTGIDRLYLQSQVVGQPSTVATVNPDGTYVARVVPGTYRVQFYVYNHTYTFFDSPDSDLVYYLNYDGGDYAYGYTAWFTVAGGDDVTFDAGVQSIYCPC